MKTLISAFAAGVVSALGFAPFGLWPLTLIALAWLMLRLRGTPTLRRALALGWWFGFGQFMLGLDWIATAFTYQAAMPAWLGWIAVLLLSLYLAIYPAIAAGIAWRWGRRDPRAFVLLFAAAWMLAEYLRSTLFTGFAWNPLGVILVPTPVAYWATIVGTYGLSALVLLTAGVALLPGWRQRLAGAAAVVMAGLVGLTLTGSTRADGPAVRVVQPNIGQDEKYSAEASARHADTYARLSGTPSAAPRLLLWPEAAVDAHLEEEPFARDDLSRLLGPRDILLTGGDALIFDRRGQLTAARNSVFALTPEARLGWRYDKAHLVPYGEYLPMRPLLSAIGLSRLVPGDLDFLPGPGPRSFDVPGIGLVGVQVCYEIIFSGHVIDAAHRPRFLFNPSNDAWFGASGPPQHLAQARLRAIEEGITIVRATPTGISAVIDPDGRLSAALPQHVAGVIDARLPTARAPTIFADLGLWASALFGMLLAATATAIASARKAR